MANMLIFDYDGVIVDSLDIFMKNLINACKINGFNQISTKGIFLNLFNGNMYENMAKLGIPKKEIPKILKNLKSGLLNNQNKLQLFDGTKEMLKKLSKDNKIIIITSNVTKVVEEFLKLKNINCFEEIVGADKETSKIKKIENIKSKFKGNTYFYIGDTRGDIIEGKKAGVKTIAVTWGWHNEDKLKEENPDFIVHSPQELLDLFKNLN